MMTMIQPYYVYWRQMNASTFMFGSKVTFEEDGVLFSNRLMPSGTLIHEWYMRTNFFRDRAFPALPLLKRGVKYTLLFHYEAEPKDSIYFKINFQKQNGTSLDSIIAKTDKIDITLPDEAFDYQIQMMNAACEKLKFHFIEIIPETLTAPYQQAKTILDEKRE